MIRTLIATLPIFMLISANVKADEISAPKALIITGDHENNWQETTSALKGILAEAGQVVDVTETPRVDLTSEKLAAYDVLLLNYKDTSRGAKANPDSVWTDANKQAFGDAVKAGAGLVVTHGASSAFIDDTKWIGEFQNLAAGGWRKNVSRRKIHELTLTVQHDHPITRGMTSLSHGRDQLHQNLFVTEGSKVLVTAFDGREMDEPVVWVNRYGKGRVVQSALGHDAAAMKADGFRTLLVRCVKWAGEKGFRSIFDGKTLNGWEGNLRYWRVEKGAIVGGSLTRPMPFHDFLCTVEEFEDFELRLEAKVVGQRNSGVCVRTHRLKYSYPIMGYEIDMGVFRWGWIYEEGGPRRILNKAVQGELQPKIQKVLRQGEFNDFVIRCEGPRIRAWMNGVPFEFVETDKDAARKLRDGTIGLQLHEGKPQEVSFRNIRVKELSAKQ